MVTIEDCLRLPEFRDAQLIAGPRGILRVVRLAHVIDEPDPALWAAPEVLVLTTGHNLPKNGEYWQRLIPDLVQKNVAALVIAMGRYLTEIPASGIAAANTLQFPLIAIPWSLPFVTISEAIHRAIVDDNQETWSRIAELQIRVTESAIRSTSLEDLLGTFSQFIGRDVELIEKSLTGYAHLYSLASPELKGWHLGIRPPRLPSPDEVLARQMAGVLAVYLLQQKLTRQTEFEIQAALADRILEGHWDDTPLYRQRMRLWGMRPDSSHRVILLSLPDPLGTDGDPKLDLDTARQMAVSAWTRTGVLITINPQGLVLVVDNPDRPFASPAAHLSDFFAYFPHSAGIMSGPLALGDIPGVYRTMAKMLPLLPPGQLHNHSDALFPAIIAELPDDLMRAFVQGTWGRLTDTVLFKTLEALVAAGGRRKETAEDLAVHRNTVSNRITQIEALLGQSLSPSLLSQLDLAHRWLLVHPSLL